MVLSIIVVDKQLFKCSGISKVELYQVLATEGFASCECMKRATTQLRSNRSIPPPHPSLCVWLVNAAEATFDFAQKDKLNDPSCGHTI